MEELRGEPPALDDSKVAAGAVRAPAPLELRRLYLAGQRAHPGLSVARDVFERRAAEITRARLSRSPGGVSSRRLCEALALASGEGLYVTIACDERVTGAWERFVQLHRPLLVRMARERGAGTTEADDIVGSVMGDLTMPPSEGGARTRLGTYSGAGSLVAWLRVIVARRVLDARRSEQSSPVESRDADAAGDLGAERPSPDPDPAQRMLAEEAERSLSRALEAAWERFTARERLVLVLRFREGVSQQRIAALLQVGEPRVSRIVDAAIEKIRAHVHGPPRSGAPARVNVGQAWPALRAALERHLATRVVPGDLWTRGQGSAR
jgi:RNA polymerase sigma-70 factor